MVLKVALTAARCCCFKVRAANLTSATPWELAAWPQPPGTGLAGSLRLLDLGGNPGLNATNGAAFFSRMPLWEL